MIKLSSILNEQVKGHAAVKKCIENIIFPRLGKQLYFEPFYLTDDEETDVCDEGFIQKSHRTHQYAVDYLMTMPDEDIAIDFVIDDEECAHRYGYSFKTRSFKSIEAKRTVCDHLVIHHSENSDEYLKSIIGRHYAWNLHSAGIDSYKIKNFLYLYAQFVYSELITYFGKDTLGYTVGQFESDFKDYSFEKIAGEKLD